MENGAMGEEVLVADAKGHISGVAAVDEVLEVAEKRRRWGGVGAVRRQDVEGKRALPGHGAT
jgi:hypothetical protein